jgi:ubiquitin C-terminal hydrolase
MGPVLSQERYTRLAEIVRARTARQPKDQPKMGAKARLLKKRKAKDEKPQDEQPAEPEEVEPITFEALQQITRVKGLKWENQNCYLNAAIQLLHACTPIRESITTPPRTGTTARPPSDEQKELTKQLRELFRYMANITTRDTPSTARIHRLLGVMRPSMIYGTQQDLTEAMTMMLEAIQRCTSVPVTANGDTAEPIGLAGDVLTRQSRDMANEGKSAFSENLVGYTVGVVECSVCGYIAENIESMTGFVVSIPPSLMSVHGDKPIQLQTLVQKQMRVTAVGDCACPACSAASGTPQYGSCTCADWVVRAPPYLLINIKRFEQVQGIWNKNNHPIVFPLTNLNFADLIHPDLRPDITMLYECVAVAHHLGRKMSGAHYTTSIKINQPHMPGRWINIDDEDQNLVSASSIVVCGYRDYPTDSDLR